MPLYNTFLSPQQTESLLHGGARLHFVGIGGVQMSALALLASSRGFSVSGSDLGNGTLLDALGREGITVAHGHHVALVADADALIYSLAIPENDPEYLAARALGIPTLSRADFLAYITHRYEQRVVISGSHGKSTVTAMLGHVLRCADLSPTVIGGAASRISPFALERGGDALCVAEGCEYRDSYLTLSPTLAALLSFDLDHVDYFEDETALSRSFERFASRADALVYAQNDPVLARIGRNHPNAHGFGARGSASFAEDVRFEDGCAHFTLVLDGTRYPTHLGILGRHNLQNALACALLASLCGVDGARIAAALPSFAGIPRRLSFCGTYHGARVLDDYAHHPTEIAAGIAAARDSTDTGRVFVVFQPHTYSRTRALLSPLATCLAAADRVLVTDVYAARERDAGENLAARLASEIGAHAAYCPTLRDAATYLSRDLSALDVLLIMGAGDVGQLISYLR